MRPYRTRSFGQCTRPDAFILLDNGIVDDPTAIRRLPTQLLGNPQTSLLIRANRPLGEPPAPGQLGDEAAELARVIEKWKLEMPVGVVHQPLGLPVWVETIEGKPSFDEERARALELEALLDFGDAVWRPEGFHYRLPSGEHSRGFVKLSDAIRDPRDAEVIAAWLAQHLRDGLGFVLDSGTLTPVYEAAARRLVEAGKRVGPVTVLEHYPRTSADVDDAVELAAGDQGHVLALLSVNSSGSVRDRLQVALERVSGLRSGQIIVFVDKDRPTERAEIETFSPPPGREPLVSRGARAGDTCPLCAGSKQSRLIAINPFTFDGMVTGQVRPIMPSVKDAQANRGLWERCGNQGVEAIAVQSRSTAPGPRGMPAAPPMTVRIEIERLLGDEGFGAAAGKAIEPLLAEPLDRDPLAGVRWTRAPLRAGAELVLVADHEREMAGFDALWAQIAPLVAPGAAIEPFPHHPETDDALPERIASAGRILIFALGTVSGYALQRALYDVQLAHRGGSYELQGLVLHARPPSPREWQTLCNSFDNVLHAGWVSFLPDFSPLGQEREVLKRLDGSRYSGEEANFLAERLRLCGGEISGEKPALFWGSRADARLTRNSIYGQQLDARTTFAAVAAAMARARHDDDPGTAPEARVFDLGGMMRSYYDPLIIAAFLRWLNSFEAWWGWQAWEAERSIETLFGRVEDDPAARQVLVPELLLATAQGKVHEAAIPRIRAEAKRLEDGEIAPEAGAALRIGADLSETLGA